jgi:ATP-binding cassette subfamily B protein
VSTGDVLTFAVLYGAASAPMRELHRIVDDGFESFLKVRELVNLHNLPEDPGFPGRAPLGKTVSDVVEADDLYVRYVRADGTPFEALRGVSVRIRRGETVGIAGPSGSGKSTFVKAVIGLITDYEGSLKVFGVEVKSAEKEELARRIAYVPQKAFLFSGSIRENVLYATGTSQDDQQIWSALQMARISEFVQTLPSGLDGRVAEQGRNLAGGEQQRLVLARVFLKGAELYVFDESTASLDNENERLVQESIEGIATGGTTILIAHRLDTLRIADRILVFDSGRIAQDGTFETLAVTPGLFQKLLLRQEREATPL